MPSPQSLAAAAIYSARSSSYDTSSFHPLQAADFITWAKPQPGEHVLDLACGTGLVSLLAKPRVGPHGTVTGVVVSEGMLDVARRKAAGDTLDVHFLNRDITDLPSVDDLPLPPNVPGFDLITCASALVLLADPARALKDWTTTLLKPNGRLIVDVPTEDAFLESSILESISRRLEISFPFGRAWVQNQDSLRSVLEDAGLHVEDVWRRASYEGGMRTYRLDKAAGLFDRMASTPMFARLKQPDVAEHARALFVEQLGKWVGADGKVTVEDCFYVGIGKKP